MLMAKPSSKLPDWYARLSLQFGHPNAGATDSNATVTASKPPRTKLLQNIQGLTPICVRRGGFEAIWGLTLSSRGFCFISEWHIDKCILARRSDRWKEPVQHQINDNTCDRNV